MFISPTENGYQGLENIYLSILALFSPNTNSFHRVLPTNLLSRSDIDRACTRFRSLAPRYLALRRSCPLLGDASYLHGAL